MDPVVAKFSSRQEAERADVEYYQKLSAAGRLRVLLEMVVGFPKTCGSSSKR